MSIDLSTIPEETFTDIVHEFLSAGVPPTTLAIAFNIDPDITRDIASQIHIRLYGESELMEAMNHLQWKAYEAALKDLRTGTPAERRRTINMILARTVGIAGKQPPGESGKLRDMLTELARETAAPQDQPEISPFVVQ